MRNLLIFVLILFAIWWVRRTLSRMRGGGSQAGDGGRRGPKGEEPEPMLECDYCRVHVPEREGVRDGDAFFCCEEHRRLGVRR